MFQTIVNAFKIKEVRKKILITILLLFIYRLGCYIPVPGIPQLDLSKFNFLQIMSAISGNALTFGTFFAMGIGPYINSSIIVQLLSVAIPRLQALSKQGEEGRRKLNNITRVITLILAIAQALGILFGVANIQHKQLFGESVPALNYIFLVLVYTAGAAMTMWLGERITDYGISNGISLLIFAGLLSSAGSAVISLFGNWTDRSIWVIVGFLIAAVLIFGAITAVHNAERKVLVQYAKQVKGRKMYGGQSTHIPIKVNSAGVMPLIFSFSILSFPDLITSLIGLETSWWQKNVGTDSWAYIVILCLLILFFSYFYNQIQFNADDVSKSIQGNGGFIPGIRPGKPTADYLRKTSNRITLFGAIFLAIVALIPSLVFKAVIGASGAQVFSATGLLIIVSVALEFEQALQSQIMMKNYKGFLK